MFQRSGSLCVDGLEGCLKQGAAGLVDYICWAPHAWIAPEKLFMKSNAWAKNRPDIKNYMDAVGEIQKISAAHGFKGGYMAIGSWWQALYPPDPEHWPHSSQSEILKAKYYARTLTMHTAMRTVFVLCKTYFPEFFTDSGSIRSLSATGLGPQMTTQAAYYVVRTMCTILDGAEPCDLKFSVSADPALMKYAFSLPGGNHLIALWQPVDGADDALGVPVKVTIKKMSARKVVGQDPLNGMEQELVFNQGDGGIQIPGVLVKDYPVIIKIVH